MKNQQKNILTAALIIILIIAASFYIYKDLHKSTSTGLEVSQGKSDDTSAVSIETSAPGQNYTVKVIPPLPVKTVSTAPKMPDLSLPVVNRMNADAAVFKIMAENIAILTESIKKDPTDETKWLSLGIYRKNIGDYSVAADILNYVVAIWPNDYVPYNNLADLYQFYIKNYPLAEKNWLKVTALKPGDIQAYQNLSDLYATLYTEKQSQSLTILLTGLENNPQNLNLLVSLARRYRAIGDSNNASIYYSKAITEADNQNNQQMAASLQQESAK